MAGVWGEVKKFKPSWFLEWLLLPPLHVLPDEMGLVGSVDEGVHFSGLSTSH